MSRGLTAAMLSEIAKGKVKMIYLVELQFSTTVYLTTHYRDVNWSSNDYSAGGNLISVGPVSEKTEMAVGSLNIGLSGVNQDNISTALTEDFIGDKVLIYLAFLDGESVIADPYLRFDGRIGSFSMGEDPTTGAANLTWSAASHWEDFDKITGRRTNHNDQIARYSGDLGFEFAAEIMKDIKWGRA